MPSESVPGKIGVKISSFFIVIASKIQKSSQLICMCMCDQICQVCIYYGAICLLLLLLLLSILPKRKACTKGRACTRC